MRNDPDFIFEAHIRDICCKAQKTGFPVFTEFLSDKNIAIAEKTAKKLHMEYVLWGGYEDANNKILSVFTDVRPEKEDFPIACIKISVTNKNAKLNHGDYMGAIMGLGIDRNVFGDIIAYDTEAYVFVSDSLTDYFIDNLSDVGREKCIVTRLSEDHIVDIGNTLTERQIIVSSERLDCFVAAICKLSRDKSSEIIKRRLVFINGTQTDDPSRKLHENDKLVIRGFGKFMIGPVEGATHKNKLKIAIKKYN